MEQPSAPVGSGAASCAADTLLLVVTSFKIWVTALCILLFVQELFYWAIPITIVGTIGVYLTLNKLKIPPPNEETVIGFFGTDFRPYSTISESFSTIRSRLKSNGQNLSQQAGHSLTIIGHRGAGLDAPENSISAFRHCKARGCMAVEFDVALTKDNVAVVFHDENLLRMTGIDRDISDMTLDELRQVDISVLHPLADRFQGERVPTFEEAVTTCISLGLKMFMDLKDSDERIVEIVLDTYKRHPELYKLAAVSSFSAKVVYLIRRHEPQIIGCMAWRPCYHRYRTWTGSWENLELRNTFFLQTWGDMIFDYFDELGVKHVYWWFLGLSAYLMNKDCVTKESSYRWMKKGVRLYLWTVNSPLEKLHLIQNVNLGYLTDTLDSGDFGSSMTVSKLSVNSSSAPNSNLNLVE